MPDVVRISDLAIDAADVVFALWSGQQDGLIAHRHQLK